MKKILRILLCWWILGISAAAYAEDPVDLMGLQESGLSAETIGRYLAQNLDSTRLAPPISAGLLTRLGEYGGDELAASYLNLDKQTAHLQRRDFSPEVVEQLLSSDVGAEKLKAVLDDETAKSISAAASPPPAPIAPRNVLGAEPTVTVTETKLPPLTATLPPAPVVPPTVTPPLAVPTLPTVTPPASSAPTAPQTAAPGTPQTPPPATPQVAAPAVQAPSPPPAPLPAPTQQPRFQDLRPGQAADPGSKLPPPLDTYELKRPSDEGPWMGVTERELEDGHRVEVNRMGNPNVVGQEVITRPSGRKVYRYYSGHTDRPAPMTDPQQERRNREDLRIIHGGN